MPDLATPLPVRRPELIIRPLGADGRFVVKDPLTNEFFQIGEAEQFLLERLDGHQDVEAVRTLYAEQFGEPLSEEDLDEFIESARSQGFFQSEPATPFTSDLSLSKSKGSPQRGLARGYQSIL